MLSTYFKVDGFLNDNISEMMLGYAIESPDNNKHNYSPRSYTPREKAEHEREMKELENEIKAIEKQHTEAIQKSFKRHCDLITVAKYLEATPLLVEITECKKLPPSFPLPKNTEGKTIFHTIFSNNHLSSQDKIKCIRQLFTQGYKNFGEIICDASILEHLLKKEFHDLFNEIISSQIKIAKLAHDRTKYPIHDLLSVSQNYEKISEIFEFLTEQNKLDSLALLNEPSLFGNVWGLCFIWITSLKKEEDIENVLNKINFLQPSIFDDIKDIAKEQTIIIRLIDLLGKGDPKMLFKDVVVTTINFINSLPTDTEIIAIYKEIEKIFKDSEFESRTELGLINQAAKLKILKLDLDIANPPQSGPSYSGKAEDGLTKRVFINSSAGYHESWFSFWPSPCQQIYDKIHISHQFTLARKGCENEEKDFQQKLIKIKS